MDRERDVGDGWLGDKSDFYFGDPEQERLPTLRPHATRPPVRGWAGSTVVGAEVPAVFVEMSALPGGRLLPNMEGTEERRPGAQHQALRPTPPPHMALPLSDSTRCVLLS